MSLIGKLIKWAIALGIVAAIAAWFISAPQTLGDQALAAIKPGDVAKGEAVFWAGGCGSCHAAKGAKGDDKLNLEGGHKLDTPAGIFISPNITPDKETGIGDWTLEQFANAMLKGVSPEGEHYFPSFPYTSYAKMSPEDVGHLWAYMKTLPAIKRENEPHDLNPLFAVRRGIGLWKFAFMSSDPVVETASLEGDAAQLERGRYLVESLGHCGECHTPRSAFGFGGPVLSAWLSGGPAPEGDGRIPNITPHDSGIKSWTVDDIEVYLAEGLTPDFDSVGGTMVSVQENMSKLPAEDLKAISAYLKAIPPVASSK